MGVQMLLWRWANNCQSQIRLTLCCLSAPGFNIRYSENLTLLRKGNVSDASTTRFFRDCGSGDH